MIVSMLARMENVTSAADAGFADVAVDDWYATAVNWAAANGIVNGISDDTFAPNDPITREQLAAMLMNYAQWTGHQRPRRPVALQRPAKHMGRGCRLMGSSRRPPSRRHRRRTPATRTGHKSPGSSDHAALPRSLNAGSGHDEELVPKGSSKDLSKMSSKHR